jgi:hypothetical protein
MPNAKDHSTPTRLAQAKGSLLTPVSPPPGPCTPLPPDRRPRC